MFSNKVLILPNRDTMLERLMAVDDNRHLCEQLYPILLKAAGERRSAPGVVMLITLAIHDYTAGMPTFLTNMVLMRMNEWIDALVPDAELAQEAKTFNAKVQRNAAAGSRT